MAILAYDDVMLREPRLLLPRRQPLENVRIDYTNSITRNLLRYDLFTSKRSIELVRNVTNTWLLNSDASYTVSASNPGLAAGSVSSATNGAYDPNDEIRTLITNKLTVAVQFTYLASTASDFIYGNTASDAANYNWGLYISTASKVPSFFIFSGTGAQGAGPHTLSAGNAYVLVGTYDGENLYCYINGAPGSAQAKTGNCATTDRRMTFLDWQTFATTGSNGIIHFGAVWNRVLTPQEIVELSRDPYQLLIPA